MLGVWWQLLTIQEFFFNELVDLVIVGWGLTNGSSTIWGGNSTLKGWGLCSRKGHGRGLKGTSIEGKY